ncbi:hypothetical protein EMIHUDRAFT_447569 [Emiliania huxleyi CCMP1516]|uniref:RING-type domain-containing protein n=2 Tax=Emiliania huxleyi TaxID=2903 RepID=A0A0D3I2R2_EMIH1|nr:hypothetical protein EMIHUDRAFT_460186 [Emiliania huxleyi CCMP1516]XP_005794499.1 hypothetical protein EMIHUDRAFT_447569 [Emiliania huxleyi CCMP1516]EOD05547.1 hypothetical protein EMIHUDRAFT_460186 [Emiliania huxleyi CCMP1516]EOD42070.1 hypothetical protein EMIHUDRAFT_447569 [Emiliania huxleyi CCMP1516]|eukprot:XP_005757976.1 hypothetical protein EMIHUDRAFT_460186 [Emiliania huxleyi CCMP1516]
MKVCNMRSATSLRSAAQPVEDINFRRGESYPSIQEATTSTTEAASVTSSTQEATDELYVSEAGQEADDGAGCAASLDPDILCSICLDFLFEPLTLKCRHSFCRLCLLQASRLAPDGGACPQCRAEISFDPKTHALDQGLAAKIEEAVPPDELEARRAHTTATLEKMAAANSGPYPLFVMRGSERFAPGATVSLHFFEPRYRLLARRAWEGDRRLPPRCRSRPGSRTHASEPTAPGEAGLQPQAALLADVRGRGEALVRLGRSYVEAGSGGLWLATGTAQRLRDAIARGAPAYNRGQARRCADIYLRAAREELRVSGAASCARLVRDSLQAEEADGGHARERKEKAAAWALRHAFDHVLTWIAYDSMPSGCTGCSVC